jgi:hypothetical protein
MPDLRTAVVHIHDEDIELYALGQLEPEQTSTIESHLSECQSCQERFSKSIGSQLNLHQIGKTKSKEKYKRSEPRFSAGDQAFLQELSPLSLDRQTVEIVDISRKGLGILAPKSVLPGTIVQVRIKGAVELGEVRHCNPSGPFASDSGHRRYRIGLRLHNLF